MKSLSSGRLFLIAIAIQVLLSLSIVAQTSQEGGPLIVRKSGGVLAGSAIRRAVEAEPENGSYLDSLGWAYFKLGKLEEAERYLKRAVELRDESAEIHEHLGYLYESQKQLPLAIEEWKRALTYPAPPKVVQRIKAKLEAASK